MFPPQGRFETCPYPTALRPYVGEVFHATFHGSYPPEDEKSASLVGAGFKPALRREIGSIGLKPAPKKPRFVVTSEMFFTLKTSVVRLFVLEKPDEYRVFLG